MEEREESCVSLAKRLAARIRIRSAAVAGCERWGGGERAGGEEELGRVTRVEWVKSRTAR